MTDLTARLAALARDLEAEQDPTALRTHVVQAAAALLPSCTAVGLTTADRDGVLHTDAATGPEPQLADELQYALGEGPCVDAVWRDPLVHSYDLRTEGRWPRWAAKVTRTFPVRSLLCIRLWTHADQLGALNLYGRAAGGFTHDERDEAAALAAHVAVALAAARTSEQLHEGMARRTTIGVALGIVMERFGLTQAEALGVLQRLSQQQNRKVRDLAATIAEGHLQDVLDGTGPR